MKIINNIKQSFFKMTKPKKRKKRGKCERRKNPERENESIIWKIYLYQNLRHRLEIFTISEQYA